MSDLLLLLLLAHTRWCLAVSGNLLPSSPDAGRAGSVASASSLGDTWLWGQCPGQCLCVPQQEPSLGVIPAAHPALLHSHVSSKVSLTLSLASVPDGCLQEGFYGNQGQEKPAYHVQCSNVRDRRAGRGVIPRKVEARAWWHGEGRVFHLLHLSWDKERLTEHSPALCPSTVVNSLIRVFFLSHVPDTLAWLLHSRLCQQCCACNEA